MRVELQYLVWGDNPEYFKEAFSELLSICEKQQIRAIPTFFDDCGIGEETDPILGKQKEIRKGWYAFAWSPSPEHSCLTDPTTFPSLALSRV